MMFQKVQNNVTYLVLDLSGKTLFFNVKEREGNFGKFLLKLSLSGLLIEYRSP